MWFCGCFTNEYSVHSTEVCEEILKLIEFRQFRRNSDNSDVIVLLKTEHITKKTI